MFSKRRRSRKEGFDDSAKYLAKLEKLNKRVTNFGKSLDAMCSQQTAYDNSTGIMKNDEARRVWEDFMGTRPNLSLGC
jgi:hypothetical protein